MSGSRMPPVFTDAYFILDAHVAFVVPAKATSDAAFCIDKIANFC